MELLLRLMGDLGSRLAFREIGKGGWEDFYTRL